MRAPILHEFAKSFHHCGPPEKLAKYVDLVSQFFVWNGSVSYTHLTLPTICSV